MKNFFLILGLLSIIASLVMYYVGSNSSHLSELYDFYWTPLPLALLSFIIFATKKK